MIFENYSLSSTTLLPKNDGTYSKKCTKNKCVCINEVILSMIMKVRQKIKNRSHRYNINRPRPRHGHKYTKYKICNMVVCVKQHLSNIWISIHEKVHYHWDWFKKRDIYKKSVHSSKTEMLLVYRTYRMNIR